MVLGRDGRRGHRAVRHVIQEGQKYVCVIVNHQGMVGRIVKGKADRKKNVARSLALVQVRDSFIFSTQYFNVYFTQYFTQYFTMRIVKNFVMFCQHLKTECLFANIC